MLLVITIRNIIPRLINKVEESHKTKKYSPHDIDTRVTNIENTLNNAFLLNIKGKIDAIEESQQRILTEFLLVLYCNEEKKDEEFSN
jgi:hypothetical protein